jgi:ketosteroid isomerase-like protein
MKVTEKNQAWLRDYYRHIDAKETDAYMAMFSENARMIFANADPIEGRAGIREALTGLLGSVAATRHVLHQTWQVDDDLVAFECDVIYTRKDGKEVTVRGGCFFVFGDDGLCREQRITVDITPVFAA